MLGDDEKKTEKTRKKKVRAENEEKRNTLRKKENTGNCPFENIGFYLVIKVLLLFLLGVCLIS